MLFTSRNVKFVFMIGINVGIHVKQSIIIKTRLMNKIFVGTMLLINIYLSLYYVTSIVSQ